jgi:hypothetical protein
MAGYSENRDEAWASIKPAESLEQSSYLAPYVGIRSIELVTEISVVN